MLPPVSPLKVLVVDDHDLVRLGIRQLLGSRAEVTDVGSLQDARVQLASQRFDLLLLDLGLGNDFSLTALPDWRASWPDLRIVVLTSMPEDLYAERALRAGADGFVMKSALGQTLLQAIDAVMAGQVYLSSGLGNKLLRRMAGRSDTSGLRPELSPREIEVLRLVGQGKSTREIADALNRSVKTIETHKQALKTKLGADTPAALVRLALAWSGEAP
jgi:DNA-binding NarL/FixJ family response regulator